MRALFFHQNFPGQYRHLCRRLVSEGHEVIFITQKGRPSAKGLKKIEYEPHRDATAGIHHYLVQTEKSIINAQGVARALIGLKRSGFVPDIMLGNPSWGETLFVKDVYPDSPLLSYCEFYFRGRGSDVGFDPEFTSGADGIFKARVRAGVHLLALEAADYRMSPTEWQKAQFPKTYRDTIEVIHDGIDCQRARPDGVASVDLPNAGSFSAGQEIVTYVSRNLEPYRGFHSFMRALPRILESRPEAQILIVGGDEVSYGGAPKVGGNWREVMLAETGIACERVHFVGRVPYALFLKILQVSSAHVYLTYPFVLSWSMLEAMASGCAVIGSSTAPIEEVIEDGENGLLVDFFDPAAIAERTISVLEDRSLARHLGAKARETVLTRFELEACLEKQRKLIARILC